MEKINNYIYENYDLKDFERKQIEMNLPISKDINQVKLSNGLTMVNVTWSNLWTRMY